MTRLEKIFHNLEKHSTKWSGYFDVYERHLSRFVEKHPSILEVGILGGGSLELWEKYFNGATITGIDIVPQCADYKYEFPVEIIIGNQESPEFWQDFWVERNPYDIIIDDGGHTMNQQIVTLENCYPHLADGGIYVVEDVHTSYWDNWGGLFRRPATFLEYSKRIVDHLNKQHFTQSLLPENELKIFEDLYSVYFYNSMVVFEKKANQKFEIVDNKL